MFLLFSKHMFFQNFKVVCYDGSRLPLGRNKNYLDALVSMYIVLLEQRGDHCRNESFLPFPLEYILCTEC